ncbi:hypothetical protein GCM10009665_79220 [Kitasatospora nipponensis]|uniref:Ribosomally synthesized peptide n=1 Tax=Kitasatospora nipponensis TaxID=258049 RepID=A0ABP4DY49_9ACTN
MSIDQDWRFAELIVRSWTEPDLRSRYQANPSEVLAEAGITAAPGEALPALPAGEDLEVVIDLFETLPDQPPATGFCLSIKDHEPTAFCLSIRDHEPAAFCLSIKDHEPQALDTCLDARAAVTGSGALAI